MISSKIVYGKFPSACAIRYDMRGELSESCHKEDLFSHGLILLLYANPGGDEDSRLLIVYEILKQSKECFTLPVCIVPETYFEPLNASMPCGVVHLQNACICRDKLIGTLKIPGMDLVAPLSRLEFYEACYEMALFQLRDPVRFKACKGEELWRANQLLQCVLGLRAQQSAEPRDSRSSPLLPPQPPAPTARCCRNEQEELQISLQFLLPDKTLRVVNFDSGLLARHGSHIFDEVLQARELIICKINQVMRWRTVELFTKAFTTGVVAGDDSELLEMLPIFNDLGCDPLIADCVRLIEMRKNKGVVLPLIVMSQNFSPEWREKLQKLALESLGKAIFHDPALLHNLRSVASCLTLKTQHTTQS